MNCKETKKLLSLYIDNKLKESQMKEVEKHLDTCVSCNKEYTEFMEISSLLGKINEIPLPDSFADRMHEALLNEKSRTLKHDNNKGQKSKKLIRLKFFSSIAAVFVVGVLTYGLYQDMSVDKATDILAKSQQEKSAYVEKTADSIDKERTVAIDDLAGADENNIEQSDSSLDNANTFTGTAVATKNVEKNETMIVFDTEAVSEEANYSKTANSETMTFGAAGTGSGTESEVEGTSGSYMVANSVTRHLSPTNESISGLVSTSPTQGIERNSAAVRYYDKLIEKKLESFEYKILDSRYALTGEWRFRTLIITDKNGNEFNEEVLIIGKSGEIQVQYANEFMGL